MGEIGNAVSDDDDDDDDVTRNTQPSLHSVCIVYYSMVWMRLMAERLYM